MTTETKDRAEVISKIERLRSVQNQLKNEFVGIDNIIEQLIDNVKPWFLFSEIQNKPLVINLWGLTGTGKTSLVMRLMELLNHDHHTYRIDLGEKGTRFSFHDTIKSLCENEEEIPLAIVLDEIQHARTKMDGIGRSEIDKEEARTVWELLDSGNVSYIKWEYGLWGLKDFKEKITSLSKRGIQIKNGSVVKEIDLFCYEMGREKEADDEEIKLFTEDDIEVILNLAGTKFGFELKEEVKEHLNTLHTQSSLFFLKEVIEYGSKPKTKKFAKSIIFVLGNLDEAYNMTGNYNADIPADTFYKESLKITVPKIKKALRKRFRDEQIARFGNIHLVYPSFDHKAYNQLIRMELEKLKERFHKQTGLTIIPQDSLIEMIYKEGVYPTQGARPVFTTIHQIVTSKLGDILEHVIKNEIECDKICLEAAYQTLIIRYERKNVVVSKQNVSFTSNLEKLRQPKMDEDQAKTAIHEAGHAILSSKLLNRNPTKIVSVSSEHGVNGFVARPEEEKVQNRKWLKNEAATLLGGMAAERLIFGEEYQSFGASGDIEYCYELVSKQFKYAGIGSSPLRFQGYQGEQIETYRNTHNIENEIKTFIDEACELAKNTLISEMRLLLEVGKYLSNHTEMSTKLFKKFIQQYANNQFPNEEPFSYRETLIQKLNNLKIINESETSILTLNSK